MGEKIANGFLFMCSIAYFVMANQLSFGNLQYPKAGFIPNIVGFLACIISGWLFVRALQGKGDAKDQRLDVDLRKSMKIIGVMVAFIVIMKFLGFIVATFVLLLATMKIADRKGWKTPLLVSVLGSVGFYVIFNNLLGVILP